MLVSAWERLILSLTMPKYCDLFKVLSAPQTVYELKSKEILLWYTGIYNIFVKLGCNLKNPRLRKKDIKVNI